MGTHMSSEVLAGLRDAQLKALRRSSRLRVAVGEDSFPVLRAWEGGFALAAEDAPNLRGTVEFCEGTRVLHECLILCAAQEGDEMHYEVKRMTPAVDVQPLDFAEDEDAPVALIGRA